MPRGNSAIVDVGIKLNTGDIQKIISQLNNALGSLGDNTNISDNIKDDIKDAQKEIENLKKSLSSLGEKKLNSRTFSDFQSGLMSVIASLENRTTNLETTLGSLIGTLSSSDGGQLSSTLQTLKSKMEQTASTAKSLVSAIGAVSGVVGNGVTARVVDASQVQQLKELRRELNSIIHDINLDPVSFKGIDDVRGQLQALYGDFKDVYKQLSEMPIDSPDYYSMLDDAKSAAGMFLDTWEAAKRQFSTVKSGMFKVDGRLADDMASEVRSSVNSMLAEIDSALAQLQKGTTIKPLKQVRQKSGDDNGGFTIPVELDSDADAISKRIRSIINEVQKTVNANPIEIELMLISPGQSKKANAALKKFQQQVDNLTDETTREQMQSIVDEVNKGFGKEISANLKTSFDDVGVAIRETINGIQDELVKNPVEVHPKIEIEQTDLNRFRDQVSDIVGQLEKSLSDAAQQGLFGKPKIVEEVPSLIDEPKKKKAAKKESQSEFQTFIDKLSGAAKNIELLKSGVSESIDAIVKSLSQIGNTPIETDNVELYTNKLREAQNVAENLAKIINGSDSTLSGGDRIDRNKLSNALKSGLDNYFADFSDPEKVFGIFKSNIDQQIGANGTFRFDDEFINKFIEDANRAGVSLDNFKEKSEKAFQLNDIPASYAQMLDVLERISVIFDSDTFTNLDISQSIGKALSEISSIKVDAGVSDQIEKISSSLTTLKNSLNSLRKELDLSSVTSSIQDLKGSLLELSDIEQRATGQWSATKLGEEFEKIKINAGKLKGLNLKIPENKIATDKVLSQYVDYLARGGTASVKDLGAEKNITRYMSNHLEAAKSARSAEEEAKALKQVEEAANIAADAKQKFADANSQLFQSVLTSLSGLDNEGKAFENLNKLLNTLGGTKGDEKLQKLVKGLTEIQNLMSTDVGADSLIKSLENMSQSGDALKDLSEVLKSSRRQIQNAQKGIIPGTDLNFDYTQQHLDDEVKEIQAKGKSFLTQYGQILGTTISKNSEGLVEMVGLIKTAVNTIQEVKITSASGDVWNVSGIEENGDRLLKRAQKLEQVRRAWERMNVTPSNVTDSITFDKNNLDADKWEAMVELAKEYTDQIGNLQKITRQVRQDKDGALLESFSFIGDAGHITMGRENDIVASSQTLEDILKIKEGYDELYKKRKDYYSLAEKEATGSITEREKIQLQEFRKEYSRLNEEVEKFNDIWGKNIAAKAKDDFIKNISEGYDATLGKTLDKYEKRIASAFQQRANKETGFTPEYSAQLDRVAEKMQEIQGLRDKYASGDIWDTNDLKKVHDYLSEIDQTLSGLNAPQNILAKTSDVDVAITKLSRLQSENHPSRELNDQISELISHLMEVRVSSEDATSGLSQMSKADFTNVIGNVKTLESEIYRTGQNGKGFWQQFSGAIQSQSANFLAQYFSLQDIIRYSRELIQTVTTLDTSLKELQKLTGESDSVMAQSFQHASETAQQYGATINSVLDSTSDWKRLGYSLSESEDLAKVTTLYQNIANGIDQQNASEYMVSIMQGFQMDASESMKIVDAVNEVAQNYAIDQAGIGEALQRSAAAFNAAHTDLNKSIALVTGANEVLQNPEKVGTQCAHACSNT